MKGTSFSHTLAMDLTPPRITRPVRTVMTAPEITGEIPNVFSTMFVMELPCVPLPIPKQAKPANSANRMPSHFCFRPLSRAYIGPPIIPPSLPLTLYLIAKTASPYLEAIPKQPVSHTQNTAPGPPDAIAVATPTILPVPMVAASAVASAPKPDTSPSASLSGVTESLMPLNTYL